MVLGTGVSCNDSGLQLAACRLRCGAHALLITRLSALPLTVQP
jgi:hypothetical protein